jgi:ribosomal protein L3 glutamine methyltransferase
MANEASENTVAAWIGRVAAQFEAAGLHFGHGTDNAADEAAWLVLHVLAAPLDGRFQDWGSLVPAAARAEIERLARARCEQRVPLAYLTGTAWFAGLEFEVGPDVLVPRSPIAELILDGFRPWLDPQRVQRVLDLCTGCGCIAIAAARQLPQARVDAIDISAAALRVAERNLRRHDMQGRVRLIRSDLFENLPEAPYDLIVANPPYVPAGGIQALPAEYRAEPGLGLASGIDGLDATLHILSEAPRYLAAEGVLVCEVGESEARLARALPRVPFLWLEFEHGGAGVFLLTRAEIQEALPSISALIGERRHVA